jgi:hypothetical protein
MGKPSYVNGGSESLQVNAGPVSGETGWGDDNPNGLLPDGFNVSRTLFGSMVGGAYMHSYLYDPGDFGW